MKRFGYILLACFILGCGGNSTGPEPTPQYPKPEPEPLPEPHIELSYENLAGYWVSGIHEYLDKYGTQAGSSISRVRFWGGETMSFSGKYFLDDPYMGARGEGRSQRHINATGEVRVTTYPDIQFHIATLTIIETNSLHTPYPSSLGQDTLRTPYPDWIKTRLDTILTLKYIPANSYRELFGLSDTTQSVQDQILSMSTAEFSDLLDSLKSKNVAGQPQFSNQPGESVSKNKPVWFVTDNKRDDYHPSLVNGLKTDVTSR